MAPCRSVPLRSNRPCRYRAPARSYTSLELRVYSVRARLGHCARVRRCPPPALRAVPYVPATCVARGSVRARLLRRAHLRTCPCRSAFTRDGAMQFTAAALQSNMPLSRASALLHEPRASRVFRTCPPRPLRAGPQVPASCVARGFGSARLPRREVPRTCPCRSAFTRDGAMQFSAAALQSTMPLSRASALLHEPRASRVFRRGPPRAFACIPYGPVSTIALGSVRWPPRASREKCLASRRATQAIPPLMPITWPLM